MKSKSLINTCSRWPRPLRVMFTVVAFLFAAQIASWLIVGVWTLPYYVKGMIKMDHAEMKAILESEGKPLPVNEETLYVILCERFERVLGSTGIEELNQIAQARNTVFLSADEAASSFPPESWPGLEFDELCYYIDWNTPLFAYVEYGKRDCALCSWGTGHRAWFVMGVWFPTAAVTSWVS